MQNKSKTNNCRQQASADGYPVDRHLTFSLPAAVSNGPLAPYSSDVEAISLSAISRFSCTSIKHPNLLFGHGFVECQCLWLKFPSRHVFGIEIPMVVLS